MRRCSQVVLNGAVHRTQFPWGPDAVVDDWIGIAIGGREAHKKDNEVN